MPEHQITPEEAERQEEAAERYREEIYKLRAEAGMGRAREIRQRPPITRLEFIEKLLGFGSLAALGYLGYKLAQEELHTNETTRQPVISTEQRPMTNKITRYFSDLFTFMSTPSYRR